ncbi:hypothetical protein LZC95_45635 [Pendulispora brunnea]|uniref:Uncharacterized protein n=1 Tax=Pendulispora brunnea TaxID=2905690 RepID=A0ABZ2K6L2_9BACT
MFAASPAKADSAQVVAERRALKPGAGLLVVDTTINLQVGSGWVADPKGGTKRSGWQPTRLKFELWGKADDAAAIVVTWKDGTKTVGTTQCAVPQITEAKPDGATFPNWQDQGEVLCDIKDGAINYSKIGTYDAEIAYRAAGKSDQLLRKINFTVRNYGSNDSEYAQIDYYVDRDYKLIENVAYWDWDGGSLHVRAITKQEGDFNDPGKLRCTMNGQPFGTDGDVNFGQDSFSYSDGARNKKVQWTQLDGGIYVSRESGRWKPGRYECQMIFKAKVLRTLRFQLDPKLGIVAGPEQTPPRPGAFASRTTFLTDVDIPAGVDAPFNRTAIERQAFLGRPWITPPKLAAGVGGAYTEPAPFTPPAPSRGGAKAGAKKGKKK